MICTYGKAVAGYCLDLTKDERLLVALWRRMLMRSSIGNDHEVIRGGKLAGSAETLYCGDLAEATEIGGGVSGEQVSKVNVDEWVRADGLRAT